MQYWRSAIVTSLALILVVFSASCGGGHSNSVGPISTITLTPNPSLSLNQGDVIQMIAIATDAKGHTVTNQTFTFSSDKAADPVTPVQISNAVVGPTTVSALLCAGAWDSLSNPVVCKAAPNSQTANIKVTAQGVTSNTVTVNVHPKIARVVVNPANPPCVSQGQPISYIPQAFDILGNDVTSQVGNFTWSVADTTVGFIGITTTPGTSPGNTVLATLPGTTTVTATVNSTNPVNSVAAVFQECPVASIVVTGPDTSTPTQANLAFSPSPATTAGTTGQLTAVVKDTNGLAVSNVPLVWISSRPTAASVSSTGLVTAVAPGSSGITASCALNGGCNKNQNSLVTSNTVVAAVSGTSAATTVYATSSLNSATSLIPIDTGSNTALTAIPLPSTPNSLVFDNTGAVGYLGSDGGLMVFNPSNNSLTKTATIAPGRVLAVSPNGGQFVIVGGKLSNGSFTPTLLFNNSTNAVSTLSITNAVAADFSPDGTEAIVADTTGIRTVQGIAVRTISNTVASDVKFLANGDFAYLANATTPLVTICNSTLQAGSSSIATTRLLGILDPNNAGGNKMLGVNSANGNIIVITPTVGTGCPPSFTPETRTALGFAGVSSFTAPQIIATTDGKNAFVTDSNVAGKLLTYDVVGNATGSITLSSGTAVTTTGGVTSDGASVYVGVNDGGNGSVHRINVSGGTDAAQIPLNLIPDLVAIRPK